MAFATHPTYPNPTIQEAICEIYFRLPDDSLSRDSWFGDFYKNVQNQFPIIQPASIPQLQLDVVENKPSLVVPKVMRYQNISGNLLLQLSETRLVINVLPDYPGWAKVKEHIKYGWEVGCRPLGPELVTGIALRYINRIDRRSSDEKLGKWLVSNKYIPEGVLTSRSEFGSRVITRPNDQDRLSVIVNDREISDGNSVFLLDIELVTEHEMSVDINLLLGEVGRLHDEIWEVFRSSKGEQLEKLLQGEIL